MRTILACIVVVCTGGLFSGCASRIRSAESSHTQTAPATSSPISLGPVGELATYGRAILTDTPKYMKGFIRADMSCSACHLQGGTKARGGSLVGIYARFPQYNKRAQRVIALQDRIAECFLYSMNGRPPAYQSKEMVALVAYLASISAGTPVGTPQEPAAGYDKFAPPSPPEQKRGSTLYAQKCSMCHQANGTGISGQFPPLWGSKSFNSGAGMHRIGIMASFVKHNMPLNAPNSLTAQQAYDISAYVLARSRPAFEKNLTVTFAPEKASYF